MSSSEVEDGFGSVWEKCNHALCDLQVVRPGKAQCSDWCQAVLPERQIAKLIEHCKWQADVIAQLEEDVEQAYRDGWQEAHDARL